MNDRLAASLVVGGLLFLGLTSLGYFIASSPEKFRQYERSVSVKGLSEREVVADMAIWPIRFSAADNGIRALYRTLENDTRRILAFLDERGFPESAITLGTPSVVDKVAQNLGNQDMALRYTAQQTITVYSDQVERVRNAKTGLAELGKSGIVLNPGDYGRATEYLFTGLNQLKPGMIEEATRNAREVALKFARDSDSRLGKIKTARQGQFSIRDRDRNNPHLKKVRVVSTIEYYLID